MKTLQHSSLKTKLRLSTLLAIPLVFTTFCITKNPIHNLNLQNKHFYLPNINKTNTNPVVINRINQEVSHFKTFLKSDLSIENLLGKSFADSLDYLHNLNNLDLDWTSALPISPPPFGVRKAGAQAFLTNDLHHYSPNNGISELRRAITQKFRSDGISADDKNILVHTSVFEILDSIYSSLNLSKINTVLIPTPNFGYYASQALNHGMSVKFIETNQKLNWKIDPDILDNVLTQTRSKVFLFNNPVNPTGAIYTENEVRELAKVLKKHHVLVIADEIFKDIIIDTTQKPYSIGAVDGMESSTITLNGVGKSMGLAGLRVSYAYAPDWLVEKIHKPLCGLSKPAEQAAIKALQGDHENSLYIKDTINKYKKRIEIIKDYLKIIDNDLSKRFALNSAQSGFFAKLYIQPHSTNVALIQFTGLRGKFDGNKEINNSLDLANYISKNAKIALVPGEASFIDGKEMVLRVPLAAQKIKNGLKNIREVLLKLNNQTN